MRHSSEDERGGVCRRGSRQLMSVRRTSQDKISRDYCSLYLDGTPVAITMHNTSALFTRNPTNFQVGIVIYYKSLAVQSGFGECRRHISPGEFCTNSMPPDANVTSGRVRHTPRLPIGHHSEEYCMQSRTTSSCPFVPRP